jgi:hypothetical protein
MIFSPRHPWRTFNPVEDRTVSQFHFHVDRVYRVTQAVSVHPDPGLMSDPFTLDAGTTVVYRGLVELGGTERFVLDLGNGKKGYSRNRENLESSLSQDLDSLMRA